MPDAIRAAQGAGVDAAECHWLYETPAAETLAVRRDTGLPMQGLNTRRGNTAIGEMGLSALPGPEADARAAIDEALAYARATGTRRVHVMAGISGGPQARAAFTGSLTHARAAAAPDGITILIEPLTPHSVPGYFLSGTGQATDIIREMGRPNLALMCDCFHVRIIEGDVTRRLETLLPLIGHIQIASIPDRGVPDHGELDYAYVLPRIAALGWDRPIGVDYLPDAAHDMRWLQRCKARL